MNLRDTVEGIQGVLFRITLAARTIFPRKRSKAFGFNQVDEIMIINLNRQPIRWQRSIRELRLHRANDGRTLDQLVKRISAIDARYTKEIASAGDVDPIYCLSDQLAVAPDHRLLHSFGADFQIRMTPQEVAVARSHVETWKAIAVGDKKNVLVLEDDFYFRPGAMSAITKAWDDLLGTDPDFDMLYLSYKEVDGGADKVKISNSLVRPMRGLWYLSGYVLSKAGAEKLLGLMPIVGPVDLWVNLKFSDLKIYATSRSALNQRIDSQSDNAYSILPLLARAGIVSSERPNLITGPRPNAPILVVDDPETVHSTAMAISILGISCRLGLPTNPSDQQNPSQGGLEACICSKLPETVIRAFVSSHPTARLILRGDQNDLFGVRQILANIPSISSEQILELPATQSVEWEPLCTFLDVPHPNVAYPKGAQPWQGVFEYDCDENVARNKSSEFAVFDDSPWITKSLPPLLQMSGSAFSIAQPNSRSDTFLDSSEIFDPHWHALSETFPGNISLFDPANITVKGKRSKLTFCKAENDVRDYTSASIAATHSVQYGRLEATIRPSNVQGIITGLFFHRSQPRQEIDLELLGSNPTQMIANVYFNPGDEGTDLHYGYRGTPIKIDLGFDASKQFHRYGIEWTNKSISWLVDGKTVHKRKSWEPTPIPHLPMQAFFNIWSSYSPELGGVVQDQYLPASSEMEDITVTIFRMSTEVAADS